MVKYTKWMPKTEAKFYLLREECSNALRKTNLLNVRIMRHNVILFHYHHNYCYCCFFISQDKHYELICCPPNTARVWCDPSLLPIKRQIQLISPHNGLWYRRYLKTKKKTKRAIHKLNDAHTIYFAFVSHRFAFRWPKWCNKHFEDNSWTTIKLNPSPYISLLRCTVIYILRRAIC